MADKIYVEFQTLERSAQLLRQLSGELSSVASSLKSLYIPKDASPNRRLSAGSCRLTGNAGVRSVQATSLEGTVRAYGSTVGSYATYASTLASRVDMACNYFKETEKEISSFSAGVDANSANKKPYSIGKAVSSLLNYTGKAAVGSASSGLSNILEALKKNNKIEGAVISGAKSVSRNILGIDVFASAEGDLLGGSIEKTGKAKWDVEEGNVSIEAGIEAEGHMASGTIKYGAGYMSTELSASAVNASASGKVGATLFEDGKFAPAVTIGAEAEASVLKGEYTGQLGTDDFNVHNKAEGSLLGARAEAGAGVGKITYTENGVTKTAFGAKAEAGAEAYLAQGEISGGVSLFGIKFDASVSGKAGGAGVSAGGQITTNGVSGKIGAGLLVGAGLEVSIDWSGFSLDKLKFW